MAIDYTEEGLEENIERSLLNSGYKERNLAGASLKTFQNYAIDMEMLLEFLQQTQPKKIERLKTIYGDKFQSRFLHRLEQELNRRGMIDCIRHGIKDRGVSLRLVYNKPPSQLNKMLMANYENNIFTISRQVHYSSKHSNSLDIVLFINGLPVVVMELKNQLTGQTVEHAKRQFEQDRDPKEILFNPKKRVVVYFAVDTDEVWMTTALHKEKTFFLPFNRGYEGGKGNPIIYNNYRTSYLWNNVLQKDSLLDILFRFVYIEKKDVKDASGKVINEQEIVIFPRYHQLDVVRKIEQDIQANRVGNNYLVQHSAGSGKTNSISWLSHRLAKVHDENNEAIFDSIIVITDRRVLDKQLQDAIYQLEHESGVVQKIDEDSNQLVEALRNKTRIIITTLQKFPFIIEKVGEFTRGKYGIIIDEAHSSQGGKASTAMTSILSDKSLEDAYEADKVMEEDLGDTEEKIVETIEKSGEQNNISFFAFTATPKPKTIEKFGTPNSDSIPEPFHVYSMRQAIQEGFILDVLQNYVTYETFYKVEKRIHDDPEVSKRKAAKEIARFVSLHPHSISQKTAIIIEHYRRSAKHKIGGKAKAMLVTRSRLHAVRYKRAFDDYIKQQNYPDLKTLVAFSSTVDDDGVLYTETEMNEINEAELPDKFSTDEYQVLIVAEKYQTGFDEPLLHTMYVDKPLSGIKAVQTLSRLNRTTKGKNDTFVLDFVNEPEEIQAAFQNYYEVTGLNDVTDPNILYDLEYELGTMQVYTEAEINAVSELEFKGNLKDKQLQERLNPVIDQAIERYNNNLEKEDKEQFKSLAIKFIRTYTFVLQIGPFTDVELHKLYVYLNYMLRKIPKKTNEQIYLADDVALEYYRNDKVFEGSIALEKQGKVNLDGPQHGGSASQLEEGKEKLSSIIERMNEHFGTDFVPQDKLSRDQLVEDMVRDENLKERAQNNSIDNFTFTFEDRFMDFLIDRMTEKNFFQKMMESEEQRTFLMNEMKEEVYHRLRER
ncbi:type I restriction endonuclease subunit R [Staphylococcus equorum]|uniref:type I restriction endonuclease subunit R n=1 Tax=Staphylococcus equorum TaxID=246432 RepID=UPI003F7AA9EA